MPGSPTPEPASPRHKTSSDLLLTSELLLQAKNGDPQALEALTARYLPRLQRWASGRLPSYARSLFETTDLVQDAMLRAIQGLDAVEVREPGVFQAYVRQAVLNRIRDQIRWARRRPGPAALPEFLEDRLPSPLEVVIGVDVLERYERALDKLPEELQQLLHLRIELDFNYAEIATMTGRPSSDAARMAVRRAVKLLAQTMGNAR